jgi:hypothetical protein
MRKLLEMCVGGLGLGVGLAAALGLFLTAGTLVLLIWAGEWVACMRDRDPPEGL